MGHWAETESQPEKARSDHVPYSLSLSLQRDPLLAPLRTVVFYKYFLSYSTTVCKFLILTKRLSEKCIIAQVKIARLNMHIKVTSRH